MSQAPLMVLLSFLVSISSAFAAIDEVTHTAQLDVDLTFINDKGKADKISTLEGKVSMSWDSGDCEYVVKATAYPCVLDTSRDLLSEKGEILVKSRPMIHFSAKAIEQMFTVLGSSQAKIAKLLAPALQETPQARADGFDVPWYTLRDDLPPQPGEGAQLWNGFAGLYVSLNLRAPVALGLSRSFTLRFHLHDLKPKKGAFDIIGNNEAGNFGH